MSKKSDIITIEDFGNKGRQVKKEVFEKEQQQMRAAIQELDRKDAASKARAQQSVNAYLASILNQLLQFAEFRSFMESNYVVDQGIDQEKQTLHITVRAKDPNVVPQPIQGNLSNFMGRIDAESEENKGTSGSGSEEQGEQLRENNIEKTEGVVESEES